MTIRPWPDEGFDPTAVHKYDVARRTAEQVAEILAEHVPLLARALGVESLERVGTESFAGGDAVDAAVVAAGRELSSTVTQFRSGELAAYHVHARHVTGDEISGRHERLLLQRGGLSICEIVVFSSLRRTLAGDTDLDQAHVRFSAGLESVLGSALSVLIGQLRQRPQVVLDPDADLTGVRLERGRSVRLGTADTGRAFVEWTLRATSVTEAQQCFEHYVARCFEVFEFGPVPRLESTTSRTPSGAGSSGVNRSFTDLERSAGVSADRRVRLAISTVVAQWDDTHVDHVSVTLDMRTATDRLHAVASGRAGESCTRLRIARPTSGAAIEELWTAFADHLAGEQ